jgi:two-component system cell cycle response regulator
MNRNPGSTSEPTRGNQIPQQAVLIADDDPVYRRMLQAWLANWGCESIVVCDGEEAWARLQQPACPQLVILDWMMPGLSGPELCRRLRARPAAPYVYLLLLTARNRSEDVVEGLHAGADDYLVKPFNAEELRARVGVGFRILKLQNELLAARDALQFQATHDALTGLWNQTAILEILDRELQRGMRSGIPPGVVMCDLDHFKQVNDRYGHLLGDVVLREVAQRLVQSARAYDWAGRYGGEEFLLILTDCGAAQVRSRAEEICAEVARHPVPTPAGAIAVTISAGVAIGSAGGSAHRCEVLKNADAALYEAKRRGRNRVELAAEPEQALARHPEQRDAGHGVV